MNRFPYFSVDDDDRNDRKESNDRWKRLSLGGGVSAPTCDILGIFDMDTATVSPVTKKFLNTAQKRGAVEVVGEELPKSFVVLVPAPRLKPAGWATHEKDETRVALSQFAPNTLVGRDDKGSLPEGCCPKIPSESS